jgi:glyoxylase-like metal-dependent hydrolase (beta-lactamase superfamily II)
MKLDTRAGLEAHCLPLGALMTNCYVLVAGGECWVADPGISPGRLLEVLAGKELVPSRILLTHGHADHIGGVEAVQRAHPGARLTCPAGDAAMLADPAANMSAPFGFPLTAPAPDQQVRPGDELTQGPLTWRVLDVSGHTPGGAAYYCEAAEAVLVGDALFAGSVGRCDIPGANEFDLLRNIREHLLTLPDDTRVWPGHGPTTTIKAERESNPFLRRP